MAKVKAKISFAGLVSMGAGEIREITDTEVLKDLISAGYVAECKSSATTAPGKTPVKRKKGDE